MPGFVGAAYCVPGFVGSPCWVPGFVGSPCKVPGFVGSPCKVPCFVGSPCKVPGFVGSPCKVPGFVGSPCKVPGFVESPCKVPGTLQGRVTSRVTSRVPVYRARAQPDLGKRGSIPESAVLQAHVLPLRHRDRRKQLYRLLHQKMTWATCLPGKAWSTNSQKSKWSVACGRWPG